ncbi:outer membrane protein assembly factor BamB family protein [Natronorubrum sp. FCH18a]|uniref:outer membrane protein assembly factor BamB family protein n=1 Tax=Natronorubrum sp. FCH18a TaxID=3447018 RepID=UPI003F5113E4
MPTVSRRAFLGVAVASGVAGCTDLLGRDSDDEDTSPADRRVSPSYRPGRGEWIRSTRSFDNDIVSPTARPPRDEPSERWSAGDCGSVLSIAVFDGVVFVGGRDGVEARRLEDGDLRWADDGEASFVTVVDGRCYTANLEELIARDAETGDPVWRHEPADSSPLQAFLEVDGTVYYTGNGDLHGVHADTGEHRWSVDGDGYGGGETLAVADRELHWTTPSAHRILGPNGSGRPTERLSISFDGLDSHTVPTATAIVDGTIALGGRADGSEPTPVRSLKRSGLVWQRPFEPAVQTPAILEDRLLVTGYNNGSDALDESTVAALKPDTGESIWETTVPEPVGPPAVADGTIYAGGGNPTQPASETGHLFALEAETGAVRWEHETVGAFTGHPLALVDDVVVFGTREGVVVLE